MSGSAGVWEMVVASGRLLIAEGHGIMVSDIAYNALLSIYSSWKSLFVTTPINTMLSAQPHLHSELLLIQPSILELVFIASASNLAARRFR